MEHSQSSGDGGTIVTIGKLRLADLAGSERYSHYYLSDGIINLFICDIGLMLIHSPKDKLRPNPSIHLYWHMVK